MEHQAPRKPARKPKQVLLLLALAVLAAALVLFASFFHPYRAIGSAMLPTIAEDDIMICQRSQTPQPGDIVVFQVPSYMPEIIVKRVIATEGQHVVIDYENNCVLVDGVPLEEPYVPEPMKDTGNPILSIKDMLVPPGHVFVLGDNRNNSSDSRNEQLGCVPVSAIRGKVVWVLPSGQNS